MSRWAEAETAADDEARAKSDCMCLSGCPTRGTRFGRQVEPLFRATYEPPMPIVCVMALITMFQSILGYVDYISIVQLLERSYRCGNALSACIHE